MDKNAKIGSMYNNGILINHSTGERIECATPETSLKKPMPIKPKFKLRSKGATTLYKKLLKKTKPIDWNGELEMKVWGENHTTCNWTPVTLLRKDTNYVVLIRQIGGEEHRYLADFDGKMYDEYANNCRKQFGLVRNVKPKTRKETSQTPENYQPAFEGTIDKLPKEKGMVSKGAIYCAPGKENEVSIKDGVAYVPASYSHEKHDMVVYYNDLGDDVEITGWEWIMSFVKLQDILDQNEYLDYVDSYPFVGIDYPASYRDGDVGFIKLFDMKGCKPLILKKGDIINKHIFHSAMKLIKKSADRLHEIRHPKTKMKAVI